MATIVKNETTGQELSISGAQAKRVSERTMQSRYMLSGRFFRKYGEAIELESAIDGVQTLRLKDGWEFVGKETKPRAPKPTKEAKPETEHTEEAHEETTTETAPIEETKPEDDAPKGNEAEQLANLIQSLAKGSKGCDEQAVRTIVLQTIASMSEGEDGKAKVKQLIAKAKDETGSEYYCEDFEDIVQDIADGYNVYMYGAAGCGKSHTAEQVARRLGLPYFEAMQMEFAHELKGYGDAKGDFVPTPFYKAMTEGGLFFLDEFDRSNSQITTVINCVLESRRFDFPVVGNVQAHPNFRIIAAGNTTMTGLNDDYVAANVLDASTRNRFKFYGMSYDKRIELNIIAEGDTELVDFIWDVRQSIAGAQIPLLVSYRNTAYLHKRSANKAKALMRGMLQGGDDKEMIRTIYGGLQNKENSWAKALISLAQ